MTIPAMNDDGPECGTAEALTRLLVVYTAGGRLQFTVREYCCYRHIEGPAEVLPPDAELHEVIIEDARARTAVLAGGVTHGQ